MTRSVAFIGQRPWDHIHVAAKRIRGDVAVAYVGSGASKLLPLRRGSRLVVDASDEAVMGGRTKPHELIAWLKSGVEVFSKPRLHAKVFVFGAQAFVGSTNVSKNSATKQVEAIMRTSDRKAVAAAREFVNEQCEERLHLHDLRRLKKMYRPPPSQSNVHTGSARSALVVVQADVEALSSEGQEAVERGRARAEAAIAARSQSTLEVIEWPSRCSLVEGMRILLITKEPTGKQYVSRVGRVLKIRPFVRARGEGAIVFYEAPKGQRIEVSRFAAKLGRGGSKRLKRNGRVNKAWANKIADAWAF